MSENPGATSADSAVWFAAVQGAQKGPMTFGDVGQLILNGVANAQTSFWKKGMADWLPASQIPELVPLFDLREGVRNPNAAMSHGNGPYADLKAKSMASIKRFGSDLGVENSKSIFTTLFDFSFSSFVTTRVIRFLYALAMVASGLYASFLFFLGAGAATTGVQQDSVKTVCMGVAGMVAAPLLFLLLVVGQRIWCEFFIVFFRIAENTQNTATQIERMSRATGSSGDSPPAPGQ